MCVIKIAVSIVLFKISSFGENEKNKKQVQLVKYFNGISLAIRKILAKLENFKTVRKC